MGIKAVFFDLDGTLVEADGSLVRGVPEMLEQIPALGLRTVIASNRSSAYLRGRLRGAGLKPDLALSRADVGAAKPSPEFCYEAARRLGIDKNEMVYVGDDNRTDAICAINAGVLYFNARWSNSTPNYGINASTPQDVVRLVRAYLLKDASWYWKMERLDSTGMKIDVRSTLPGGQNWDPILGPATFKVLKQDTDTDFPVMVKFSRFVLLHLLTIIYLDQLHDAVDTWCVIPPSGGNTHRKLLPDFINAATKLFKAKFRSDLIYRHRPAQKAAYARAAGADPGFLNQANTLHLNPNHRKSVEGKHVLVVDDFCTKGHSFECARQLLYRGGASHVTCVSVGRYGSRLFVQVPRSGLVWNPWEPQSFKATDFQPYAYQEPSDESALPAVRSAFDYLRTS